MAFAFFRAPASNSAMYPSDRPIYLVGHYQSEAALGRAFGADDAGLKGFWQQGRKVAIADVPASRLKSLGDATTSYIFIDSTAIERGDVADYLAE
jgi:hypothetical protein